MWPQPPVLRSTIWIRAVLPASSETFQARQSSASLFGPVVVRTTLPSTSRLTAVSVELGSAGASAKVNWSARMCPQPPVLSSAMSIRADLPLRSATFQLVQLSVSPSLPVVLRTTAPSTTRLIDVGPLLALPGYGWFPPPARKLM